MNQMHGMPTKLCDVNKEGGEGESKCVQGQKMEGTSLSTILYTHTAYEKQKCSTPTSLGLNV